MSQNNQIISPQQWSTFMRHVFRACPCIREHKYLIFLSHLRGSHTTINTTRGQASLNSISVCWKTSGGESIMLPLTGQRWDINIYSGLPQITFRGFCLHFLSLICFSCLGPLRFQAVCPLPTTLLSFALFRGFAFSPSQPKSMRCRHGTQVIFLLRHKDPLAQKEVQTYKHTPSALNTRICTITLTHTGTHARTRSD